MTAQSFAAWLGNTATFAELRHPLARELAHWIEREPLCRMRLSGAYRSDRHEWVEVHVDVELPQRPVVDLRHHETVLVGFDNPTKPPSVFVRRGDFPRTPHQNVVPKGWPAAICIDDRPWAEARLTFTAPELAERIHHWFERAARGELHDVGRAVDPLFLQPGPVFVVKSRGGITDVGVTGGLTTTAIADTSGGVRAVIVEDGENDDASFAAVAVRTPAQEMRRLEFAPTSLGELAEVLAAMGIDLLGELRNHLDASLHEGLTGWAERRLLLLLDVPLADEATRAQGIDRHAFVFGASVGELAQHFGLVHASEGKADQPYVRAFPPAPVDDERVHAVPIAAGARHEDFTRELAAALSGRSAPAIERVVLVGVGAIGSMVAETLMREGLGTRWTVVDPDLVLPHNLARHTAPGESIGLGKAAVMAGTLKDLRSDLTIKPLTLDVLADAAAEDGALAQAFGEADFIIDASASVAVGRHIADLTTTARRATVFFAPAGGGAALLLDGNDLQGGLRHLETLFHRVLLAEDGIADCFAAAPEGFAVGGSCREVTTRLATSRARILSGLVADALHQTLAAGGSAARVWGLTANGAVVVKEALDDEMLSGDSARGCERHQVGAWTVAIDEVLVARLARWRREALPRETGGIVLGTLDRPRRRIDVVDVRRPPGDSSGTASGFTRGTAGLDDDIRAAMRRTFDQVRYVGEWHSHPEGVGNEPSRIDNAQLTDHAATLASDRAPGFMIIQGGDGIGLHLHQAQLDADD